MHKINYFSDMIFYDFCFFAPYSPIIVGFVPDGYLYKVGISTKTGERSTKPRVYQKLVLGDCLVMIVKIVYLEIDLSKVYRNTGNH